MRLVPSRAHEALIELVRSQPHLVAELLRGLLSVAVPAFAQARVESGDLSQLRPTEFRADAVVALSDDEGRPIVAVVVEVQRSCERTKRYTWPVYLATLRSRLRCDALLVVIAPDAAVARWCAAGIPMGHPKWVLEPLVVGPEAVPVVIDPQQAIDQPWLAVLSVLAHHGHEQRDKVLFAAATAVDALDEDQAGLYLDVMTAALPELARRHLEELMAIENYEYQSDFARHYFGQGRAKGKAEDIITVLAARGMRVSEADRQRILSCTDASQLTAWLERAVNARSVDDVFV